MATFKIIKKKSFNTPNATGTTYVLAYKGRAFNCSTLSFESSDLIEDSTANTLTVNTKVELVPDRYINSIGEMVTGYKLMPVLDLTISNF